MSPLARGARQDYPGRRFSNYPVPSFLARSPVPSTCRDGLRQKRGGGCALKERIQSLAQLLGRLKATCEDLKVCVPYAARCILADLRATGNLKLR